MLTVARAEALSDSVAVAENAAKKVTPVAAESAAQTD